MATLFFSIIISGSSVIYYATTKVILHSTRSNKNRSLWRVMRYKTIFWHKNCQKLHFLNGVKWKINFSCMHDARQHLHRILIIDLLSVSVMWTTPNDKCRVICNYRHLDCVRSVASLSHQCHSQFVWHTVRKQNISTTYSQSTRTVRALVVARVDNVCARACVYVLFG